MNTSDIFTARLRLVAITPELLDAETASYTALAARLEARIPHEWPDSNWEPHVFDFFRKQFAEHPETIGWNRYVVLPLPEPVLIGTVGAFSTGANEAETGYAILKPWQRNGYATEATRAVLRLLSAQGVHSVIAHTFPAMQESIRVMKKCGMRFDGEGAEEGTIRYRITLPSS
ncbi:GNAT family N-acetyltransferase [Terriglobus sp. RCC_193]|uniref:GNAT family N-acetyltransferase n=1 Tax=Terriglobus sp. RCC_193 TaxID=3239218 RepID=UPI0035267972